MHLPSRSTVALGRFLLVAIAIFVPGCATYLPTPPYALTSDGPGAYAETPESFREPAITLFYVTDRLPETDAEGRVSYRYQRNLHTEYGAVTLQPKPQVSWDNFVADSTSLKPQNRYQLVVENPQPQGMLTSTTHRLEVQGSELIWTQSQREAFFAEGKEMRRSLQPWLDAGCTEAMIFVHGFNNTFADAARRTAAIWHYSGRTMIPIMYTWPAGSGGGLLGYTRDRESSEFTVTHLKAFLRLLAEEPRLEKIHIVSHSRGTDVASTAVREMHMALRNNGERLRDRLKIATLILAAPDIDQDVFVQRYVGEEAINAPNRLIIYVSRHDGAIGLSDFLFRSERRIGRFRPEELTAFGRDLLSHFDRMEIIECDVSGFGTSHNYAFEHPSVFSDLVLILRDDALPGDQRPLNQEVQGAWLITNDYLKPE